MKKIIAFVCCCLIVVAATAQTPPQARQQRDRQEHVRNQNERRAAKAARNETSGAHLQIEHATYNFGDVQRFGGNLTRDFKIVNDGTSPLVITRVITSCSCLKASFPKRPVAVGASDVIRVTYEPHKGEPGTFHKVIQVYSNSVDKRHVITVQGNSLDTKKKKR
ncbi:MAG: DUF1573 domain-containing protein [Alistipes sp.]